MTQPNKITRQETKKLENWRFFRNGTQTLNSSRSLDSARDHKSIIYLNGLWKPIEIYIYAKKHPFTSYPAGKNQNKNLNLRLQTYGKNQWAFLWYRSGIDFSSRNNFVNSGSFAKVCVPVGSIILWSVYSNFELFASLLYSCNVGVIFWWCT